jgi:hypothetical protein
MSAANKKNVLVAAHATANFDFQVKHLSLISRVGGNDSIMCFGDFEGTAGTEVFTAPFRKKEN